MAAAHPDPSPSQTGFGRGPPAPPSVEQGPEAGSTASSSVKPGPEADSGLDEDRPWDDDGAQQQSDGRTPRYHMSDSDKFRNVWERGT